MQSSTLAISTVLVFLLLFIGGTIALQIFLSKKENKWAGLVMPFLSFAISIVALLGVLGFSVSTGTLTQIENGVVIEQTTTQLASASSIIGSAIYLFILCNIPTGLLLAIYAACRDRRSKLRALGKMSIQDLE